MAHEEPHSSKQFNAETPRLNNESDENEIDAAVVVKIPNNDAVSSGSGVGGIAVVDAPIKPVVSTVEQIGAIFKLDIDCFEELFEYLSLAGLISGGKTCKRLQTVAVYSFRKNYTNVKVDIRGIRADGHDVEHFSSFIRNIDVIERNGFYRLLSIASKLHSLRQVDLRDTKITEADIHRPKGVFNKVEVLRFANCLFYGNLHEMLSHCGSLKHLDIHCCKHEQVSNWSNQKYPTLEYFKIHSKKERMNSNKLANFLNLNPNIRKLATDIIYACELRDFCRKFYIKLDSYAVRWKTHFDDKSSDKFYNRLNDLHRLRFYKHLELYLGHVQNQGTL